MKGAGWDNNSICCCRNSFDGYIVDYPGFSNMGFGTALLAAIVIAVIDYVIQKLFKMDASPFGRGIVGFLLSALVIYLTQFFVPGMEVNVFGAIVAALIIGIIDAIIPTNVI